MSEDIRNEVKKRYGRIAASHSSCGCSSSCCDGSAPQDAEGISSVLGYEKDEMASIPDGANLGLGCGTPLTFSEIKDGEKVLDLGSGAGFDAFLAAKRVGPKGFVYGVDMTDEMLEKATLNARKGGFENVSFLKGYIEEIPLPDQSVDLIISNCVINLSPDQQSVFNEAFRVLKSGGRISVSDIVLKKPLPAVLMSSKELYSACVTGANLKSEYIGMIEKAGFRDISILKEVNFPFDLAINDLKDTGIIEWAKANPEEARETLESVLSITVRAVKQ
ncbi:MAG TPA: arsenite methyltransferase [Acidobacteriota bacterium]|nr:arsenite methyltransferase [Acidobacteriota bacterium]HNT18584.1 arsenite methyltransferase [Acidobacteriota bacterium]